MVVDELILDCPSFGTDKIVKVVKEKETYNITNTLPFSGIYSITKKSCKLQQESSSGNIQANSNFIFTPNGDGEYTLTFEVDDKKQTIILTHYPTIINSIIKGVKDSLCSDNCGCNKDADNCLVYQDLFAEMQLMLGLYKSIPTCGGKDAIKSFISNAVSTYRCELVNLFCEKELELKTQGTYKKSVVLTKKLIAINYLALYFYELWITNPAQQYVDYVNHKYKINSIKDCINKAGIEIFALQTIFDQITASCDDDYTCNVGCLKNLNRPYNEEFSFEVNTQLSGIYSSIELTNTCFEDDIFINKVIYRDSTFKVLVKANSGQNPTTVPPGGVITLDFVFEGTKTIPTVLNIPFIHDGVIVHSFTIRFINGETPNKPPVITDIIKQLENRTPYTFTVADFENHFTDADGDTLDRVVIVGDTSRLTLNGNPYISGTEINRNNITDLVYTPLDTDDLYQVILEWMAYDSYGLPSN